jgi:hypothetical protein
MPSKSDTGKREIVFLVDQQGFFGEVKRGDDRAFETSVAETLVKRGIAKYKTGSSKLTKQEDHGRQ